MDIFADAAYVASLIFAAVEIAKTAGLPGRFAGVFAVLIGIPIAQLHGYYIERNFDAWPDYALLGFVAALMAAGVYSGTKAAARGPSGPPRDAKGRFVKRTR